MVGTLRRNPSALLLAAQLLSVLAYPFLDSSALGRAGVGVVGLVVVAAALWAVRRTPALTWVALLVGVPAMVFTVLEAIYPSHDPIVLVSALLHAPLYLYVSYGMVRYVFADEQRDVRRDLRRRRGVHRRGLGLRLRLLGRPGGLAGLVRRVDRPGRPDAGSSCSSSPSPPSPAPGSPTSRPVLAHARSLSMVEQVTGVFYIAFVVARMVALTVVRRRPEQR